MDSDDLVIGAPDIEFPPVASSDIIVPGAEEIGEIDSMRPDDRLAEELGLGAAYTVAVRNPWVDDNREIFDRLRDYSVELDDHIRRAYNAVGRSATTTPNRVLAADDLEPFGQTFYHRRHRPALRAWFGLVPSVAALQVIRTVMPGDEIGGHIVDGQSLAALRLLVDSVAIADRTTLMTALITNRALPGDGHRSEAGEGPTEPLVFLSVGSGTTLAAAAAARAIASKTGEEPELHVVDHDPSALSIAETDARSWGLTARTIRVPHLLSGSPNQLTEAELERRPTLIEMAGFLEYVPSEAPRSNRLGAADLIADAYRALAPGGTLVLGQMASDRPAAAFFAKAVGWSFIQMRSPGQMIDLITRSAGIDGSQVCLYRPDDDRRGGTIFDLYLIDKPQV